MLPPSPALRVWFSSVQQRTGEERSAFRRLNGGENDLRAALRTLGNCMRIPMWWAIQNFQLIVWHNVFQALITQRCHQTR